MTPLGARLYRNLYHLYKRHVGGRGARAVAPPPPSPMQGAVVVSNPVAMALAARPRGGGVAPGSTSSGVASPGVAGASAATTATAVEAAAEVPVAGTGAAGTTPATASATATAPAAGSSGRPWWLAVGSSPSGRTAPLTTSSTSMVPAAPMVLGRWWLDDDSPGVAVDGPEGLTAPGVAGSEVLVTNPAFRALPARLPYGLPTASHTGAVIGTVHHVANPLLRATGGGPQPVRR